MVGCFFLEGDRKISCGKPVFSAVLSKRTQEFKAILFNRVSTRRIRKLVVLLFVNWSLLSLHNPCSYCKSVSWYFISACLQVCLILSFAFILRCRMRSFCNVFVYLTVCFGSLLALNHWVVIPSLCRKCLFLILPMSYQSLILIVQGFVSPKLTYSLQFQVLQRLSWSMFTKSAV